MGVFTKARGAFPAHEEETPPVDEPTDPLADLAAIVCELSDLSIDLNVQSGRLVASDVKSMPTDLRERVRRHRAELVEMLGWLRPVVKPTKKDPFLADFESMSFEEAVADFKLVGELPPCPKCGTQELWHSLAGNLSATEPGRWRCQKCDPPTRSRRYRRRVEMAKWLAAR